MGWKIGASTEIQSANDKNSFAYISRDVRRETHARKRKKERERARNQRRKGTRSGEKRKPGGPGFINTLEDKLASWLHDLIITAPSLLFRLISLRLARKRRQEEREREREAMLAETLSCHGIKTSTALLTEPRTRSFLFSQRCPATKWQSSRRRTSGGARLIFRSGLASFRKRRTNKLLWIGAWSLALLSFGGYVSGAIHDYSGTARSISTRERFLNQRLNIPVDPR